MSPPEDSIAQQGKGPGTTGKWKDGFHLDCGLPATLLLNTHGRQGPWMVVRVRGGRHIEIRRIGKAANEPFDSEKFPLAWRGPIADHVSALLLCERFNGWEMAREFPPPKAL